MTPEQPSNPTAAELRRQAEASLRQRQKHQVSNPAETQPTADTQRLKHELQVHQVELEMQNAELHAARGSLEDLLQKYTDLYDFSPVGYFTLTREGKVHLVNLTGASLVGIPRAKLAGQSITQLIGTDQRPAFRIFLEQVFTSGIMQEGDFHLLRSDQTALVVKIRGQLSPSGQECSAVVVDITERTQREQVILENELRLSLGVKVSGLALVEVDYLTDMKHLSAEAARLFGLGDAPMVVPRSVIHNLFHPDDLTALQPLITASFDPAGDGWLALDHRIIRPSGEVRWLRVREKVFFDGPPGALRPVHSTVALLDITAEKMATEAMHRSEALFAAMIEKAPFGVYVVDAAFRFQQINPKALPAFVSVQPLLGRDFAEIVHLLWPKRAADKLLARFRHTLKTGEPYQSPEFTEKRRDTGEQEVYEWQIQRVTLPAGEHGVVCFFNNITERKRAEWVRRRLDILTASNQKLEAEIVQRQAVEKSLKRSEQDQLRLLKQAQHMQKQLRSFSHQIITAQEDERKRISRELHDVIAQTLVGINVHLGTLTRAAEGTPKSLLVKIQRTQQLVEKAADTVHQFARELRPTVLDDLGLIPALEANLKSFTEDTGVRATIKVTSGIEAKVGTRRTSLFRIVQEALTNVARHAQATNVTITIKSLNDGTIRMEITDDGRGFEGDGKSGTAKNKRLGLLGMRERVEMINGTFNIDSTPGGPTTIRVEIPVS